MDIYPPRRYRTKDSVQIGELKNHIDAGGPTSQALCIYFLCDDVVSFDRRNRISIYLEHQMDGKDSAVRGFSRAGTSGTALPLRIVTSLPSLDEVNLLGSKVSCALSYCTAEDYRIIVPYGTPVSPMVGAIRLILSKAIHTAMFSRCTIGCRSGIGATSSNRGAQLVSTY